MSNIHQENADHPQIGSRCMAGPEGRWGLATIRRLNEDGTFTIEPDERPTLLMPYWYGVTPSEVSFNDSGRWPGVLARLTSGADRLTKPDFARALSVLG